MLSDRDYMREPDDRPAMSMTVRLMIALVAVFAAVQINAVYGRPEWTGYLPLSLGGIQRGFLWQLVTFQFLHGGLLHLASNLLGLWICGRFVEHVVGRWRFLAFYLGTGMAGGLLHLLLAAAFPTWFGIPVFGASAGVMALVALFCLLQPEAEFLMFFVLRMKAKTLLIVEASLALFFTVVPSDPGVAHAAHLGGIIAAFLFFRAGWHDELRPLPWAGIGHWFAQRFQRRRVQPPKPAEAPWKKPERRPQKPAPVELSADDFMAREVDPILEKIAAHGIHSLTAREKETLERARSKMSKR